MPSEEDSEASSSESSGSNSSHASSSGSGVSSPASPKLASPKAVKSWPTGTSSAADSAKDGAGSDKAGTSKANAGTADAGKAGAGKVGDSKGRASAGRTGAGKAGGLQRTTTDQSVPSSLKSGLQRTTTDQSVRSSLKSTGTPEITAGLLRRMSTSKSSATSQSSRLRRTTSHASASSTVSDGSWIAENPRETMRGFLKRQGASAYPARVAAQGVSIGGKSPQIGRPDVPLRRGDSRVSRQLSRGDTRRSSLSRGDTRRSDLDEDSDGSWIPDFGGETMRDFITRIRHPDREPEPPDSPEESPSPSASPSPSPSARSLLQDAANVAASVSMSMSTILASARRSGLSAQLSARRQPEGQPLLKTDGEPQDAEASEETVFESDDGVLEPTEVETSSRAWVAVLAVLGAVICIISTVACIFFVRSSLFSAAAQKSVKKRHRPDKHKHTPTSTISPVTSAAVTFAPVTLAPVMTRETTTSTPKLVLGPIPTAPPHVYLPECEPSDWLPWSACSGVCGWGVQYRWRAQPSSVKMPCPSQSSSFFQFLGNTNQASCGNAKYVRCRHVSLHEVSSCKSKSGCAPEIFADWGPWSPCNATCGPGTRVRRRARVLAPTGEHYHLPSLSAVQQYESCMMTPCDISCDATAIRKGLQQIRGVLLEESLTECSAPLPSGRTCLFHCPAGEHAERPAICVSGVLVGPMACVARICRDPPFVLHAVDSIMHACIGYGVGSFCPVRCEAGYEVAVPLLECSKSGTWEPSDVKCEEIRCKDTPHILHGSDVSDCRNVPPGERCPYFMCNSGYMPTTELICRHGNFNRPFCEEKSCKRPPKLPAHADIAAMQACSQAPSRTACPLRCLLGYHPGKMQEAICDRGQWTEGLICIHKNATSNESGIYCHGADLLAVPNSEAGVTSLAAQCATLHHGEICDLKCAPGMTKSGDLMCAGGRWLATACLLPACHEHPTVAHSLGMHLCAGSPSGYHCRVICMPGFENTGDGWLTCVDGHWEPEEERCSPVQCNSPLPVVAHGRPAQRCVVPVGGRCMLDCLEGYDKSSDYECLPGGVFSAPQCLERSCTMQLQGMPATCAGTVAGDVCHVSCPRPRQDDNTQSSMQANLQVDMATLFAVCVAGNWSFPSITSCRPVLHHVCNGPLPPIAHSITNPVTACASIPMGGACKEFTCSSGFQLAHELQCTEHLHLALAACVPRPCTWPAPALPDAGHAICNAGTAVCPTRCYGNKVKRADLTCEGGVYSRVQCEDARNSTLEAVFANLQVHPAETDHTPSVSTTHWQCALAVAAGLPVWRIRVQTLENLQRPQKLSDTVNLEVSFLPAWSSKRRSKARHTGVVRDAALTLVRGFSHRTRQIDLKRGRWPRTARDGYLRVNKSLSERSNHVWQQLHPEVLQVLDNAVGIYEKDATAGQICIAVPFVTGAADYNTLLGCRRLPSGSRCPVVCPSGYHPEPADPYCMDGHWTAAACKPRPCSEAPVLANAGPQWHCNGTAGSGAHCKIICRAGWHVVGKLICVQGSWTTEGLGWDELCAEDACMEPPRVAQHSLELAHCRGITSGGHCQLVCRPGYLPEGNSVLTCKQGRWHHEGSRCIAAPCIFAPQVENASVVIASCAGIPHNGACNLVCALGFESRGELVCLNGHWTAGAHCIPAPCREVPLGGGLPPPHLLGHCVPTKSGDACAVRCPEGQQLSAPVLCQHGHWDAVSCIPTSELQNHCAASSTTGTWPRCLLHGTVGSRCQTEACPAGYDVRGALHCANGTWRGAQCVASSCLGPPQGHNVDLQSMTTCRLRPHGSQCLLLCAEGFSPGGMLQQSGAVLMESEAQCAAVAVSCDRGHWRGASCLPSNCSSDVPQVQCTGDTCRSIACTTSAGLELSRSPSCNHGAWDMSNVHCVEAPCLHAPRGSGLKDLAACAGSPSGHFCQLRCDDPFAVASPPELLCNRGQWMPSTPACVRRCETLRMAITQSEGLQHCLHTDAGGKCLFHCALGYAASGALECAAHGRWRTESELLPFCYPVNDGTPLSFVEQVLLLSHWAPADMAALELAAARLRIIFAVQLDLARSQVSVTLVEAVDGPRALVALRLACLGTRSWTRSSDADMFEDTPGVLYADVYGDTSQRCLQVKHRVAALVGRRSLLGDMVSFTACAALCGRNAGDCRARCHRALPMKVRHRALGSPQVRRLKEGLCGSAAA